MNNNPADKWHFSGDEEMNTTIHATAVSDKSTDQGELISGSFEGVTRLTSTDHGFKATSDLWRADKDLLILVTGTDEYDGMRKIVAVATNTIDIVAAFVAETPGGTETLRAGFKFADPVEFLGFKLHLNAASATAENLVCQADAAMGAAWDTKFYSKDMNGVQDIVNIFSEPIPIAANDEVYFTWANTNDTLWGLEISTRRI